MTWRLFTSATSPTPSCTFSASATSLFGIRTSATFFFSNRISHLHCNFKLQQQIQISAFSLSKISDLFNTLASATHCNIKLRENWISSAVKRMNESSTHIGNSNSRRRLSLASTLNLHYFISRIWIFPPLPVSTLVSRRQES